MLEMQTADVGSGNVNNKICHVGWTRDEEHDSSPRSISGCGTGITWLFEDAGTLALVARHGSVPATGWTSRQAVLILAPRTGVIRAGRRGP